MLKPQLDYCLLKKIDTDTGVVTTTEAGDTHQKWEVLAVGEGRFEIGVFVKPTVKVGDTVYIQKHAEADTPPELEQQDMALVMASRIMAVEGK